MPFDPAVQTPMHGFNRLVILAGWFAAGLVLSIVLAIAGRGLPRADSARGLSAAPLALQLLIAIFMPVAVFTAKRRRGAKS